MPGVDTLRSFITPNRWKSWDRPPIPALADIAGPEPQEIDFTSLIWRFSPHADLSEVKAADVLQLEPWERVAVIYKLEQLCRSYPVETAGCWCSPCAIVQIPAAILASLLIEEPLIPDISGKVSDYRYEVFEAMSRMNWWCFNDFRFKELLEGIHEPEKGGCRRFYHWVENYVPLNPPHDQDDTPSILRIKRQEIAAGLQLLKVAKVADLAPFKALEKTEGDLSRFDCWLRKRPNAHDRETFMAMCSDLLRSGAFDATETKAIGARVKEIQNEGGALHISWTRQPADQHPPSDTGSTDLALFNWMLSDVCGYPQIEQKYDDELEWGNLEELGKGEDRLIHKASRQNYFFRWHIASLCPRGSTRNGLRSDAYVFIESAIRLMTMQPLPADEIEKMQAIAHEYQGPFTALLETSSIAGLGPQTTQDEYLRKLARSGEIGEIFSNFIETYRGRQGMPNFKNYDNKYYFSEVALGVSKLLAACNEDISHSLAWLNLGHGRVGEAWSSTWYADWSSFTNIDNAIIQKIKHPTYDLLRRMMKAAEAVGVPLPSIRPGLGRRPSINPLVLARINEQSPVGLSEVKADVSLELTYDDGGQHDWKHWVSRRQIHWNAFFAFWDGIGAPCDRSEAFTYLAILFEADRAIARDCEPETAKEFLRKAASPLLGKSSFDVFWDEEHDPYWLRNSVEEFLKMISPQEVAQAVERLSLLPKNLTGNHGSWAAVYDEVNRRCFGRHYEELTSQTLAKIQELGPNQAIADYGAGTGRLSIPLAKAGHRVCAIEPSSAMIEQLRMKADGIDSLKTYVGTMAGIRGIYGYFDLSLAVFTVIAYILTPEELEDSFTSIGYKLKPEGKLLVDVPSEALFRDSHVTKDGLDRKITFVPLGGNLYDYVETTTLSNNGAETKYEDKFRLRYWTEAEVKDALSKAGLEIKEDWSSHFPMAGATYWLCRKRPGRRPLRP